MYCYFARSGLAKGVSGLRSKRRLRPVPGTAYITFVIAMSDGRETEIEITPEMVEAAVRVIADLYGICSEHVAEGLARDTFKAMIRARNVPCAKSPA
jgi:hypothetical protein